MIILKDRVLSKSYVAIDDDWVVIISPAARWYSEGEDIYDSSGRYKGYCSTEKKADMRATDLGNWIKRRFDID